MKYTEFEARVKELDSSLSVKNKENCLLVKSIEGHLLTIVVGGAYEIDTAYANFARYEHKKALFYLATELAATPLEERVEQKKYYYRLPHNVHHGNYLNFDTDEGVYYSTKKQLPGIQTQFTREEYATIAKEHGIPEGVHIAEEVTE